MQNGGIPAKRIAEPEPPALPQPGNTAWFEQQAATAETGSIVLPVADPAPRQGAYLGNGKWEADAPGTPHPEGKSDKRW
jgi:hypothetical protein